MTAATARPRTVKSFKLLVGLEIHVQLATASKMFTAARNGFGAEPNTQVDPQVMGLPGTLPVMNKKAVEYAIMTGLALNCHIARQCKWDRKSYYYPDLPKNYQISQYDQPLCYEGTYDVTLPDGSTQSIRIRRAHLEEDSGKLLHDAPGGYAIDYSIVDLNRAGTPLLEIVTEPDFSAPEAVAAFAKELQMLVQYLGVSEGQMQMGHMRFEPNINVHITDGDGNVHKTAITEIKNLNSFSVLERATAYEVQRQLRAWTETGDLGKKATYGWDDAKQQTVLQREKEEAHDYRYFPDPDLVPVETSEEWLSELRSRIGELPQARRKRYRDVYELNDQLAADISQQKRFGDFLDGLIGAGVNPKRAAVMVETIREMANDLGVGFDEVNVTLADAFAVAKLAEDGLLPASKEVARKVLEELQSAYAGQPGSEKVESRFALAKHAAEEIGLIQSSDTSEIDAAIEKMLASNPKPLEDYKAGKQAAFGALVGMVMKQAKGLNPKLVQERLREKLG